MQLLSRLYWWGWGDVSGFADSISTMTRTLNTNNIIYSTVANSKGYLDIFNTVNTTGKNIRVIGTLINNVSPYAGVIALQKAAATLIDQSHLKSSQVYAYFGRYYDRDTSQYVGNYYTSETAYSIETGATVDTPTHITVTWNQAGNNTVYKINALIITQPT